MSENEVEDIIEHDDTKSNTTSGAHLSNKMSVKLYVRDREGIWQTLAQSQMI